MKNDHKSALEQLDPKEDKVIEISKRSSIFGYFLGAMIIFGCCFVIYLFIFDILFMQVSIKGYSMQPTINASATGVLGDQNIDWVFCFKTNNVKNKDIVVIRGGYTNSGDDIIKRVIAKPKDKITFKKTDSYRQDTVQVFEYEVYINDVKLEENYIKDQKQTIRASNNPAYPFANQLYHALDMSGEFSVIMGDQEYFVMGDNRDHSTDSRVFGPVKKEDILGKVVIVVHSGQTLFDAVWAKIF